VPLQRFRDSVTLISSFVIIIIIITVAQLTITSRNFVICNDVFLVPMAGIILTSSRTYHYPAGLNDPFSLAGKLTNSCA